MFTPTCMSAPVPVRVRSPTWTSSEPTRTCPRRASPRGFYARSRGQTPQRGELRRDELAVVGLSFEDAHLAGEPAGMGDHLLGNRRLVERGVPGHLERDETRL